MAVHIDRVGFARIPKKRPDDPLAQARGLLSGLILAGAIWICIAAFVLL